MIVVSHEMQFAREVADKIVFMEGGYVVEEGDPDVMFTNPRTDRAREFLNRIADFGEQRTKNKVGAASQPWNRFSLFIERVLPVLWQGTIITLQLASVSLLLGMALGLPMGVLRVYGPCWARRLVSLYVLVFQGTPLLVQLFIIYYGLPQLGPHLRPLSGCLYDAWACTAPPTRPNTCAARCSRSAKGR